MNCTKMVAARWRETSILVVYWWICTLLRIRGLFGSRKTKTAMVFVNTHNFRKWRLQMVGTSIPVVHRLICSKLGIQRFFGSRNKKISLVFVNIHDFPKWRLHNSGKWMFWLFNDGFARNSVSGIYLGRESRIRHGFWKYPQFFEIAATKWRETNVPVV